MHDFIRRILIEDYGEDAQRIYDSSKLIEYLDSKMGAINGNSKSRRSFANIYAIYSITHFYVEDFFGNPVAYRKFTGYEYTKLFLFYRSLYGGEKLQNHALNSRVNGEFLNKFPDSVEPIVINKSKYTIHIDYLYVDNIDISKTINRIVEEYINILIQKDSSLMSAIEELCTISDLDLKKEKISKLITDRSEARIFEIVSYAILKNHYKNSYIYIGKTPDSVKKENLQLFKTGRTNANDGGIDFVMRPLGRFFQVTEVDNYNKYTLDMDKVLHFPITFVIKTSKKKEIVEKELDEYIELKSGGMEVIKQRYYNAIEEIITINELKDWLNQLTEMDINDLLDDIETYYKLELNLYSVTIGE